MVVSWILFTVRFAAIAVVGHWLAANHGSAAAFATIAVVATACGLVGAWLLHHAPIGRIAWQNRAAGWLLPFGSVLHAPQLPGIVAGSLALSVLAAAAGIGNGGYWLLTAAWTLDALAAALVWQGYRRHTPGSGARRRTGNVLALVLGLAIAGFTFLQLGQPSVAITVAGGLPATVGAFLLVWILFVVTVGRNARWN